MPPSPGPILIVEDNRDTREAVERILAISGYSFVSARDARAALDHLKESNAVAAIVLDIHMPGMDGRAFLRELKSNPAWEGIPVVVFSCDPGEMTDVAACVHKGTDEPDVLLEAIAACWRR
jgi:CheY-like chemotaxis protein